MTLDSEPKHYQLSYSGPHHLELKLHRFSSISSSFFVGVVVVLLATGVFCTGPYGNRCVLYSSLRQQVCFVQFLMATGVFCTVPYGNRCVLYSSLRQQVCFVQFLMATGVFCTVPYGNRCVLYSSLWQQVCFVQFLTATGGVFGAITALTAEQAGERTAWILAFTSGGFLYIALVTVVPDLLQEKHGK